MQFLFTPLWPEQLAFIESSANKHSVDLQANDMLYSSQQNLTRHYL